MDFDQELPSPLPHSNTLRRAQAFDLLGQVACFLVSGYLAFFSENQRDNLFLDRNFGVLFQLGAWQLGSALLHLFVWQQIPGRKQARRIYLISVGILAACGVLALLSADSGKDGFFLLLFALLFLSPGLALLYFCITALDLWKLSGGVAGMTENGQPVEGGRRVVFQAILLFLILVLLYRLPFAGNSILTLFYPVGYLLAVLGLAGWLFAGYLSARRNGQASLAETVCVVWAGALIVFELAVRLFKAQIVLPLFWLSLPFSPALVLAVWYTVRLWRGPLLKPGLVEEATENREDDVSEAN